jgi:hypothetical protein
MDQAAAILMLANGLAIAGIWTHDIFTGDRVERSAGVFAARDPDAGTLLWPHWLAEYATAASLIVAAAGLLADADWAVALGGIATGALLYTGTNSLSWALAARDRLAYAIPMLVGVVTGLFLAMYLLTR